MAGVAAGTGRFVCLFAWFMAVVACRSVVDLQMLRHELRTCLKAAQVCPPLPRSLAWTVHVASHTVALRLSPRCRCAAQRGAQRGAWQSRPLLAPTMLCECSPMELSCAAAGAQGVLRRRDRRARCADQHGRLEPLAPHAGAAGCQACEQRPPGPHATDSMQRTGCVPCPIAGGCRAQLRMHAPHTLGRTCARENTHSQLRAI